MAKWLHLEPEESTIYFQSNSIHHSFLPISMIKLLEQPSKMTPTPSSTPWYCHIIRWTANVDGAVPTILNFFLYITYSPPDNFGSGDRIFTTPVNIISGGTEVNHHIHVVHHDVFICCQLHSPRPDISSDCFCKLCLYVNRPKINHSILSSRPKQQGTAQCRFSSVPCLFQRALTFFLSALSFSKSPVVLPGFQQRYFEFEVAENVKMRRNDFFASCCYSHQIWLPSGNFCKILWLVI